MTEVSQLQLKSGTLSASFDGDLGRVKALVDHTLGLLTCQYDYTSPLHLALREGHADLVEFLVERGAFDPSYRTHPFLEPLLTVADDADLRGSLRFCGRRLRRLG